MKEFFLLRCRLAGWFHVLQFMDGLEEVGELGLEVLHLVHHVVVELGELRDDVSPARPEPPSQGSAVMGSEVGRKISCQSWGDGDLIQGGQRGVGLAFVGDVLDVEPVLLKLKEENFRIL